PPPPDPPPKPGEDEMLEVLAPGTPGETSRDEDGLPLERDAGALELRDDGCERLLPRGPQGARDRQRHGLDDDRDACSWWKEPLQGRSGEREAKRLLNRGSDVGQRLSRRRRPEHVLVVSQLDDLQPRAEEKRNLHLRYGIERYRRRNVGGRPRFGQKREERTVVSLE